jgi:hypothetical protein
MGKHIELCVVVGALALAGCGTSVSVQRLSDNEYQLIASPPGGMFAFFAGSPSKSALPKKAAEVCPVGYDKLSEERQVFEGVSIYWKIRCQARAPQS